MDVALLVGILAVQPAPEVVEEHASSTEDASEPAGTPSPADEPEPAEPVSAESVPPEAASADEGAQLDGAESEDGRGEPAASPVDVASSGEPEGTDFPRAERDSELSPMERRHRARDAERPPIAIDEEDDEEESRAGSFISFSVGAGHCGTSCSYLAAIGGGRFEAGYRWGHVALGGSLSLIGGRYDTSASDGDDIFPTADARGSTRFFNIGPTLQLFLASQGRFDPYVSIGVGYRRLVDVADVENAGGEVRYWESGLGVTLGAGVPVYVAERVTLGLRYDKVFAVGGKECATIGGMPIGEESECRSWSKRTDSFNVIDKRFSRLARPRPWTLSFELRVGF